jgi:hypothetical protein
LKHKELEEDAVSLFVCLKFILDFN